MTITPEQQAKLWEAAAPLRLWLERNCHPHCEVTVSQSDATLTEGIARVTYKEHECRNDRYGVYDVIMVSGMETPAELAKFEAVALARFEGRCMLHATVAGTNTVTNDQCQLSAGHEGPCQFKTTP